MATLTIKKIKCIRKQDLSGSDEPVIEIGGQYAWEGKMKKDDVDYPNEVREFSPSIKVELKEKDQKKSKLLGSWTISNVAVIDKKLTASSSGFHYELYCDVAA